MTSILIKVTGFIGDTLFSTSVARRLKKDGFTSLIDYKIPVYPPYEILQLNNSINRIFLPNEEIDESVYDKVLHYHLVIKKNHQQYNIKNIVE